MQTSFALFDSELFNPLTALQYKYSQVNEEGRKKFISAAEN